MLSQIVAQSLSSYDTHQIVQAPNAPHRQHLVLAELSRDAHNLAPVRASSATEEESHANRRE